MMNRLRARLNLFLLGRIDSATSALTEYRARLSRTELGTVANLGPRDDMRAKIRLLINLRWGVHLLVPAVLLLLASQGLQLRTDRTAELEQSTGAYLRTLWPNFALAATALGVNLAYAILLKKGRSLRPIAHAQVWLDTAIFALVIFGTGGSSSPFAFLYTIPVLAASLLLSFQASVYVALSATALLGLQAWLQLRGLLPNTKYFEPLLELTTKSTYLLTTVTLNGVLYLLIAGVSGVLSQEIKRQQVALARRANEATMLHEVSATLQEVVQLDEVLTHIMDILVRRLEIDRALMYLVNEGGDALELKVVSFHPRYAGAPRDDLKVRFALAREAGLTAVCAIEKRVFNVTDPLNHPLINRELAAKIGLNPFVVAPMLARGKVIGVLGCDRKFQRSIITNDEAQTISIAANQAGLTIQNAHVYERFHLDAQPAGGS